jgi:hypothetical protein
MPQPNPGQNSRNALDNLQDQRLRSVQAGSISSATTDTTFIKPPPCCNGNHISQARNSNMSTLDASAQMPASSEALQFLAATAVDNCSNNCSNETNNQTQLELNFSNPTLLDTMTVAAPQSQYSNFRETRNHFKSSPSTVRHDSMSGSYSFSSDAISKRSSESSQSSDECSLVNGRRYTPLTHLQSQPSQTSMNVQQDFMNRNMAPHRTSVSNFSTSV